MLRLLKRHPFPVVAWFEKVVAVSFAFPEEILRPLVPEPVEIDCHDGLGCPMAGKLWIYHSISPANLTHRQKARRFQIWHC